MKSIRNSKDSYTYILEGLIDMETAPEFERGINMLPDGVRELILDFNDVEYMSSAGLRVILFAKKKMGSGGNIIIKNIDEKIRSIFDMTGTTQYLNFE